MKSYSHLLRTLLLLTWLTLGGLAACATMAPAPRFPHKTHLLSEGTNCLTCHKGVLEATTSGAANLPGYPVCARCHGDQAGPQKKYRFDPAVTFAASPERRRIVFSHQAHAERTRGQCVRCHRDVQVDVPTPGILPSMQACLEGCHQRDYDMLVCTRCHRAEDLPHLRPVTDIPHGVDYVPRHMTDAARSPRLCSTCHQTSWCTSCHDTSTGLRADIQRLDDVNRDYSHRGDFITRHPIEARQNPTRCMRCHQPSSCDSCHVRNHVSGNVAGGVSPHPLGWVGDASGADFHGRVARRRIVECAACHDQGPATNCIRCHKVGAYGGNPHPSGWGDDQSRARTDMCQYCHAR